MYPDNKMCIQRYFDICSELTLDMFRMVQTLEREPQEDLAQLYDTSPGQPQQTKIPPFVRILRRHFKGTLLNDGYHCRRTVL